uniref:C2 domain-containing protein n=1 Tax=Macrostomum lignano TaxID=282301 RepID=A0A1I8GBD3_9PLAT
EPGDLMRRHRGKSAACILHRSAHRSLMSSSSQQQTPQTEVPFVIPTCKRPLSQRLSNKEIGHVDPTLYLNFDQDEYYEVTEEHIGRIWFRVRNLPGENKLEVSVFKARNLYNKARRFTNTDCSAFVSVELPPLCNRTWQTKVRKNTNNPDINETFVFDKVIGHAFYTMRELGDSKADSGQPVSMWRDLSASSKAVEAGLTIGLMHITLSYYEMLERLVVTVNEVHQIKDCQNKDIFIKLKRYHGESKAESKQSSHHQCGDSRSVRLSESFQFKVPKDQRRDTSLILSVFSGVRRRSTSSQEGGGGGQRDETPIGRLTLSYVGKNEEGELMREAMKDACREAKPVSAWLGIVPMD